MRGGGNLLPEKVAALCDQLTQECIGITHACKNKRAMPGNEADMDELAFDYLSHIQKLTLQLTQEIIGNVPAKGGVNGGNPNT